MKDTYRYGSCVGYRSSPLLTPHLPCYLDIVDKFFLSQPIARNQNQQVNEKTTTLCEALDAANKDSSLRQSF